MSKRKNNTQEDSLQYIYAKKVAREFGKVLEQAEFDESVIGEYLKGNKFSKQLVDQLSSPETVDRQSKLFASFDCKVGAQRLYRETTQHPKLRLRVWISAAAVAAVVVLCSLFYFSDVVNQNSSKRTAQLSENANPRLILSTGEIVELRNGDQNIDMEGYHVDNKDNILTTKTDGKTLASNVYNTLIIPSKKSHTVILSDGTSVILNSKSSLRYPVSFGNDTREVELEGEAYFNVSKSTKPFIVRVKNVGITVYGTRFNVKGLMNGAVETVLVEGSVGVNMGDKSKEVKIRPNQRVVCDRDSGFSVSEVDVSNYTAWTSNNFMYNGKDLAEVIVDLENWYGVSINGEKIDDKVDLYIDRNSSIDKVLKLIEETTNYKFTNKGGGTYIVKAKR